VFSNINLLLQPARLTYKEASTISGTGAAILPNYNLGLMTTITLE
jgi:hypothetical protein